MTVLVTLYTKPGCHLCEQLHADLAGLHAELPFVLVERDITEDAADEARFRDVIPVLAIGTGPLLYPPHDLTQIRAALLSARRDAAT